jgi:hypothetical protein
MGKGLNRDTELLKIQILADYYHSQYTTNLSFYLTGFLTMAAAVFVLVVEGHISPILYWIYLFVIALPFGYWSYSTRKTYSKNLNGIDGLIEQVENNKPLPSLKELKKKVTKG